jgi:hypothetical protein
MFRSSVGKFSSSKLGILPGMTRITITQLPRCIKTLTRKRDAPARLYETSHEPCSRRFSIACLLLPTNSLAIWRVSSGDSGRAPTGESRPLTSTIGGLPGVKNRSLIFAALRSIAANKAGVEGTDVGAGAAAALAVAAGLGCFVGTGPLIVDTGISQNEHHDFRSSKCIRVRDLLNLHDLGH